MNVILAAIAAVILGASFMLMTALGEVDRQRVEMRNHTISAIDSEFELRLNSAALVMRDIADSLAGSDSAQAAFQSADPGALAKAVNASFHKTPVGAGIEGIRIFGPDGRLVYGTGAATRPQAENAAAIIPAAINELGICEFVPMPGGTGNFALRLVIPWKIDNETTAFIEVLQNAETIFGDFRRREKSEFFLLPAAAIQTARYSALPPELRTRFGASGKAARAAMNRLLRAVPTNSIDSETSDLDGGAADLFIIPAGSPILTAPAFVLGIHDAQAREVALMQLILRQTAMWIVGTLVFVGACLWLSLRQANSYNAREQERLREREQRVSAVMDAVVDGIVTIRADGTILSFNPAAETIFAMTATEAVGQNVRILMPSGIAGHHQGYIDRYLATGRQHIIGVKREVVGRRKDGTEFPMDLAISRSAVGGDVIFIGVMRDVSDRKAANDLLIETLRQQKATQQALRRRGDELVRAAKALSAALDKAEAANDAKSRFLATMSHELRTPMNGILGMAGLLLSSPLTDGQKKWAVMIRESGEALLTLLNDILDLSKIEAGRFEIRAGAFDPIALARQIAVSWEHQAHEKGITLNLDVPPESPRLLADAMRIRQILTNYVSNALKFTERGFITVKASFAPGETGRVRMRYEISDTGRGIAEENLPALFEKFPDLDPDVSRQHNGAGLGLAICREIATLMGGKVGAESVPGVGSVFWLELDCEEVPAQKTSSELANATSNGEADGAPVLKILVAEDHPVNQKLFQALLGHMGHEVHLVQNGREAVERIAEEPFDLVLMDANMPVMDGPEAVREIRALGGTAARVPVIVVTAEAMVGDRERFLALGMDDYLTKPIDARELADIIARHGGKPSQTSPPRELAPAVEGEASRPSKRSAQA